jgi:hypothetical protein
MAGLTPGQTVETHPSLDNGLVWRGRLDVYAAMLSHFNPRHRPSRTEQGSLTVRFFSLCRYPTAFYTHVHADRCRDV